MFPGTRVRNSAYLFFFEWRVCVIIRSIIMRLRLEPGNEERLEVGKKGLRNLPLSTQPGKRPLQQLPSQTRELFSRSANWENSWRKLKVCGKTGWTPGHPPTLHSGCQQPGSPRSRKVGFLLKEREQLQTKDLHVLALGTPSVKAAAPCRTPPQRQSEPLPLPCPTLYTAHNKSFSALHVNIRYQIRATVCLRKASNVKERKQIKTLKENRIQSIQEMQKTKDNFKKPLMSSKRQICYSIGPKSLGFSSCPVMIFSLLRVLLYWALLTLLPLPAATTRTLVMLGSPPFTPSIPSSTETPALPS